MATNPNLAQGITIAGKPKDENLVPFATGRLSTYPVDELHPHPSYVRHQLHVSPVELSALATLGDLAFAQPIAISSTGSILFGYAQFEYARLRRRPSVQCIEYDLSDEQALEWLLRFHRQGSGLNPFVRILLALDLESSFHEKARANQSVGGKLKGLSNLTSAEKLDVRAALAATAGACVANVDKVKQIRERAHHDLICALHNGEISIHCGWAWSKLSFEHQLKELRLERSKKGVRKAIASALSEHRSKTPPTKIEIAQFIDSLSALSHEKRELIDLVPVRAPRQAVFVSDELWHVLKLGQKNLSL